MQLGLESNVIILDSESTMKEDMVEEEDGQSSLTDHEIDVEDIDDGDDGHPGMGKSSSVVHRHRHHQQGSHSNVRSFKEEEDEDEELDKEDVVDEEDETPLGAVKSKKKSGKKSGKSSGSGSSGSSSNSNPQIKPKCNCDQLRLVDCHLETKELWDKFNELGTEMIITKTGRSDSLIFSDQSTTTKSRLSSRKLFHCLNQPISVRRRVRQSHRYRWSCGNFRLFSTIPTCSYYYF